MLSTSNDGNDSATPPLSFGAVPVREPVCEARLLSAAGAALRVCRPQYISTACRRAPASRVNKGREHDNARDRRVDENPRPIVLHNEYHKIVKRPAAVVAIAPHKKRRPA